jgi:hypothetical protein
MHVDLSGRESLVTEQRADVFDGLALQMEVCGEAVTQVMF